MTTKSTRRKTYKIAVSPRLDKALRSVVRYLEHDEYRYWQEIGSPRGAGHIWNSIRQLRDALPNKSGDR